MANFITAWWQKRRERYYKRRWHLAIEIFLSTVILLLAGLVLWLPSFQPPLVIDGLAPHSTGTPAVTVPKLEAEATITDSAVYPGERVAWNLKLINTGESTIERVEIALPSPSLSRFRAEGAEVLADKIIVHSLSPKEEADVVISALSSQDGNNRSIKAEAEILAITGSSSSSRSLALPEVRFKSELKVTANAYYHSPQGDQLGIGPVPPVVGIPTTYWLIIQAENEGNSLKDFALSFRLPSGVELSGEQSLMAGKFSYDKGNRRVIWQINSLEASGGHYIANFGLTLTPRASQIGKEPLLAESFSYHALDSWTGGQLSGHLEDLDTSLPADRFNDGSGKVQMP
ncbi:MAG: hypothetical protein ACM3PZ_02755 [Bacillota bacterium]